MTDFGDDKYISKREIVRKLTELEWNVNWTRNGGMHILPKQELRHRANKIVVVACYPDWTLPEILRKNMYALKSWCYKKRDSYVSSEGKMLVRWLAREVTLKGVYMYWSDCGISKLLRLTRTHFNWLQVFSKKLEHKKFDVFEDNLSKIRSKHTRSMGLKMKGSRFVYQTALAGFAICKEQWFARPDYSIVYQVHHHGQVRIYIHNHEDYKRILYSLPPTYVKFNIRTS